jgi:hypothetical protein
MKVLVLLTLLVCTIFVAAQEVVLPYLLKATAPITVDASLDEWAFSYPIVFNVERVDEGMRCSAWPNDSNEDLSGVVRFMWDDDNLYFSADVVDDVPGIAQPVDDPHWLGDCIEIYIASWDIGDLLIPEADGWVDDGTDFACKLEVLVNATDDIVQAGLYNGSVDVDKTDFLDAAYVLTDDGYILEGLIAWEDMFSQTTGGVIELTEGTRVPFQVSLFDRESIDDTYAGWGGYQLAIGPNSPAGPGVGPGWIGMDVKGARSAEDGLVFDFVEPYIKHAPQRGVIVDAKLTEWEGCFPCDCNIGMMNAGMRSNDWIPTSNEDCSGVLKYMYDADYLYFSADIKDETPGIAEPAGAHWLGDAIEIYIASWDIGDVTIPEADGWVDDGTDYACKLEVQVNATDDVVQGSLWDGTETDVTDFLDAAYAITDDGYILEGMIAWEDMFSQTTGGVVELTEGDRVPFSIALYNRESLDDVYSGWGGYQYAPTETNPAGDGPGPAWAYADIKGLDVVDGSDVEDAAVLPEGISLGNYPNPFNPNTNITFNLENTANISLYIYDVTGKLVQTLINNQVRSAGENTVQANMANQPSGIYFAVLEQADARLTQKMMLVK